LDEEKRTVWAARRNSARVRLDGDLNFFRMAFPPHMGRKNGLFDSIAGAVVPDFIGLGEAGAVVDRFVRHVFQNLYECFPGPAMLSVS